MSLLDRAREHLDSLRQDVPAGASDTRLVYAENAESAVDPLAWDPALADAWIAITLERIGRLYDDLAPGSQVDSPEWDRAEAVVSAAYVMKNRQALRDSLGAYEAFAKATFEARP